MASDFLKRKVEEQAKRSDKEYNKGIYGNISDIWEKAKETSKKSSFKKSEIEKRSNTQNITDKIKIEANKLEGNASNFLKRKVVEQSLVGEKQPYKPQNNNVLPSGYPVKLQYNEKKEDNPSAWDSFLDSAGYIGEKLGKGAVDGLEGMSDFGWSIPLALGWGITSGLGLFDNPVENKIESWYNELNQNDVTDSWGEAEKRYDAAPDKVKEWGWLPETLGNIAPFVAETMATGGASSADDLAVAGKSAWDSVRKFVTSPDVHFGMSAGGEATERAVDKGANPLTATNYGTVAGALEMITEKLFGGYAGTGIGKTATTVSKATKNATKKTLLKKIWDSPVTKKILDIGAEGLEENIVTFGDPILQRATGVDKNAEWATWSDYVESGTHGIILSVVMNAMGLPGRMIQKHGKSKVISKVNEATEVLNGLIQDDTSKLQHLSNNATEEEIISRQKELQTMALAFDNAVKKAVENERQEQPIEGDTLEKAAMDVVANRNATQTTKTEPASNIPNLDESLPIQEGNEFKTENRPPIKEASTQIRERVEFQSRNNEPVAIEDVKKASGFGDSGARLLTEIASRDGMTFQKAIDKIKIAYLSGYSGENTTFTNDLENRAKLAGIDDRIADNELAIERAKTATVFEGAFTENEHTKNYTKKEKKMIAAVAKALKMDISAVDEVLASITYDKNGEEVPHYANAKHEDGKMEITSNRDVSKAIYRLIMHEGGHRMRQLAPSEFGVLMNALYKRADGRNLKLGVSHGMAFDLVKNQHDNAGITMTTDGYIEEVAVRELETIFSSEREFIKWYEEISGDKTLRTNFERFIDWVLEVIEDIKTALKNAKLSKGERAEAKKTLAELDRIKDLLANAFKAAENAAETRAKEVQNKNAEINSDKHIENKNYSLREIAGKQGEYGLGVYLDTNIFDGIKPRNWNNILAKYVYKNLAGEKITVYSDDGVAETISFAKENERVRKEGAKNSHKVIDKLARTKGNINSLAIVHIDELIETSKKFDENSENSHQWLDQNGWEFRKAYVMDKIGGIYETTLNIAKSRDGRNVLYALSNTKKVDDGDVSSASSEEGLAHNNQPFDNTIPQNQKSVKRDFSLRETDNVTSKDRKDLLDIIEHLKGEFEITKFAKADQKKLGKMTRDILKEYSSQADYDKTFKAIDELYQYMANGEDGHPAVWEDVYNIAYHISQEIVENAIEIDDSAYREYKHLRDYLRNTPLKFNAEYDSVPSSYENFNEFRKKNMGRLNFTKDGNSIDSIYRELSSLYPEFFDAEEQTNSADQLERIIDVLDELQPTEINPFDRDIEQASMYLANDLTSRFFDIPQAKPTFADKAERRVVEAKVKGAKKVDTVRQQKDDKIQKLIESHKTKTKKLLEKAKASKVKAVEKEKAKRETSLAKMSENQKAKVLRARIIQHTGELNKTLLKATDKKHIPPELQNAVLALLYNINMESNYTYDVESNSYKKNDKGLPTNKTRAFLALKEEYRKLAKINEYNLTLASELVDTTESGVYNIFDEVMKLSDKKLADMTSEELTKIWDAIRLIEHSIATANKMFAMQKWEGLNETGKAFDEAISTRRPHHASMNAVLDVKTPLTFLSHFGEPGIELYYALQNAENNQQKMVDELAELVQDIVSLEQVQKANHKIHKFTTAEGEKLTLTTSHIMNIYLLYNRDQGKKHLLYDPENKYFGWGIYQPEINIKTPKITKVSRGTESIRLTESDIQNIISKLNTEDKQIADSLQRTTLKLAEWGNKACMEVFGYEKFKAQDYWLIKPAREGIEITVDKNKEGVRSIKNMGSAKQTQPEATNAVEIFSVFDVFDKHASDMICYSAWLGVMEDATKLHNYTFRNDDGSLSNRNFQGMLDKYAGKGANDYYFNLLKDIQNGMGLLPDTRTERFYTKLYGMSAKAKVSFKFTVVSQQAMSIVRAADTISPMSIMQATVKGGVNLPVWAVSKVRNIAPNQSGQMVSEWYGGWQRALKYSPIASRKAIGGYDINSHSSGLASVLYKPKKATGKSVDALKESPLWAAGKMDEMAWGLLWNACEIETRRKNKALEKGSEAHYEATAELFGKVINETQVVDGVLRRSQLMRSSSGWVKHASTFTGEPTQALNMVIRAYDVLRYEKDSAKRGKAIKNFSRATTVFLMSAIFTALARSLAVGVIDEDDEEYWKKVWKSFSGIQGDEETWFDYVKNIGLGSDVVNNINPLSWLPITRELLSVAQKYDVERLDVATIADFVKEGAKFIESFDDEGKFQKTYSLRNLLFKAAELTGYSPYNLVKDIEGAIRTTRVETNDVRGLYDMEKWRTKPATNTSKYIDILYKAYTTDNEAYDYIYNDMIKNGIDADKIKNGMETRMKKAEGVNSTKDLETRYYSPEEQKKYDEITSNIYKSKVWKRAEEEKREEIENKIHVLLTGEGDSVEELREHLAEGKEYGVDESEYLLYSLALSMVDQEEGEKGSGSYSTSEKADAMNSLNLDNDEMAFLWNTEEGWEAYEKGVRMDRYIDFKDNASTFKADKNAEGKSISGSKKAKVVDYLNDAKLTEEEWDYFYYELMGYKR